MNSSHSTNATSTVLVAIVLVLLAIGIVMLASTSQIRAEVVFRDSHHFLKRQVVWTVIAIAAGVVFSRLDYHLWQKPAVALPLAVATIAGLCAVFIPGFGIKIGGSHRWLRVAGLSVQPSELGKFTAVVLLCSWALHVGKRIRNFMEGVALPLGALGVILFLLLLEPDFGTTMLVGLVGMLILFRAGARVSYLCVAAVLGGTLFALAVLRDPVRMGRILAFLMPDKYPEVAYHLNQSKVAFINGGWFGVGLGNSIQKHLYLPEAHTDFIFAIIGEELGLAATGSILAMFAAIMFCGYRISLLAPDGFGSLLAFGLTSLICIQAAINIGVVTGCLPTKGLPLPFISYGGSSLVISVACVGVLLNIGHHLDPGYGDEHTRRIRDQTRML